MTMTEFDRIFVVVKRTALLLLIKNRSFSYSAHTQQLTALFLTIFALFCLTSHSTNEQTAEKCCIFAEEKQHSAIWKQAFIALVCIFFAEEKQHLSKNIQASLIFCIRFAFSLHRQPMKVLREPLRRHLLRPRAVTIDDRRRSSIKTQRLHYRAADKVLNYHSKNQQNYD